MRTLVLGAMLVCLGSHAPASDSPYTLLNVTPDVYRFTAGHHHALVVDTADGIVLVDPLNTAAATWLKGEVRERFGGDVRYVIYSHSHPDHVYGGDVFDAPGTVVIAHEAARANLERTRAETRLPDLVFDDTLTLHAGDKTITLTYFGPNNGYGNVAVAVAPDQVMFVVDWVVLGRLPYKDLMGYDLEGMIRSTERLLERPFIRFVGGHADMGTRDDVRRYLAYLTTLHDTVLEGILAGETLEAIQADSNFSAFSSLAMYDEWLPLNIAGAYEQLITRSYLRLRPDR